MMEVKMAQNRNTALEEMIGRVLMDHNYTIACAESCTGGLLTSRFTDVSGSSDYIKGSIVSYTNEIKINILKVKAETIEKFEVVSTEVALEMAEGVRKLMNSDIGVGITGVAGPTGSTEKSPVGCICIAVAGPNGNSSEVHHIIGNRREIKWQATEAALMLIRKFLLDKSMKGSEDFDD